MPTLVAAMTFGQSYSAKMVPDPTVSKVLLLDVVNVQVEAALFVASVLVIGLGVPPVPAT